MSKKEKIHMSDRSGSDPWTHSLCGISSHYQTPEGGWRPETDLPMKVTCKNCKRRMKAGVRSRAE